MVDIHMIVGVIQKGLSGQFWWQDANRTQTRFTTVVSKKSLTLDCIQYYLERVKDSRPTKQAGISSAAW